MKRRPPRRNSNLLDFQKLEPRQLLAGDLVGSHQVSGELPAHLATVVNGDFEEVTASDDNFYTQEEVAGWSTRDAESGNGLNLFNYLGGHGLVLNLDSTDTAFDRVYQNVETRASTDYLITFDFRSHPSSNPNPSEFTNDFEVWWNGSQVGRFTGGDLWHTGTIQVTSSSGLSTELLFCEIPENGAPSGDGFGPLLDNIRVVQTSEVTVSNNSFETTNEARNVFFRPVDVDDWKSGVVDAADRWLKIIESDEYATDANHGDRYLNLDATAVTRDIVYRDLDTTPGDSYYVTFDLRTDGDQSTNPDELRVRWNDTWAGTFRGSHNWQTVGLMLKADTAETRLAFLEPGNTTGEGSGPLIDNVRIFHVLEVIVETNDVRVDTNGISDGVDDTATHIPGAGAQAIAAQISLTHESGTELSSVIVTLNGVVDGAHEIIAVSPSVVPDSPIIINGYDSATRQLVLSGRASLQEYQTILRSLSYYNSATNVSTSNRTVTVTAFDNTLPATETSASATIDLAFETDQATIDDAILQKYIADNNLNAVEVVTGLYVVIDQPGTGQNPTINSSVRVKYSGYLLELAAQNRLVEGTNFDFSSEEGITFPLSGVIRGWQIGIPQFMTGGSGKLLIASGLAYGPGGSGAIPANAVLVFDVELKQIVS